MIPVGALVQIRAIKGAKQDPARELYHSQFGRVLAVCGDRYTVLLGPEVWPAFRGYGAGTDPAHLQRIPCVTLQCAADQLLVVKRDG